MLFTGKCQDVTVLGKEGAQMAVLDSACASTVAGIGWFEDYKESLSDGILLLFLFDFSLEVIDGDDRRALDNLRRRLEQIFEPRGGDK